jgi:hypothetical protein
MLARIKREPALAVGLVQTVLGLVLAFGVDLSNEQVGAIMAVTAAVLALVTRSQVTPTADPGGDPGQDGNADASLLLIILTFVGVVLLLFGVSFR